LTFFILGVGLWQFAHAKREAFPEVTFDLVVIRTAYPGALPEEVDRLITGPVEDTLKIVDNVDHVESYSIEGMSLILVRLDEGLNRPQVSRAVSDIQQAVSRTEDLPDEAKAPIVEELTSSRPLIVVSVAGGDDFARDTFAERIKDMLEDIPGVSRVDQNGDRNREIWVEADAAKLARSRLTLGEIAGVLRAENVNLSAGSVEVGRAEMLVRTAGSFETAEDVADVILRGNDERSFLRVRDVARVRETFSDAKVIARAGGMPSINLQVRKKRDADAITLAKEVKKLVREQEGDAARLGIKFVLTDDWSFFIKRRLNVLRSNMIQGGILILAALFLFLDWRLALVAAAGVPISFGLAMLVGSQFGLTINLLSLLGFIIVLGMLDDDSVAVAENIYRHLEMGKPPQQAAVDGVREIMLPVLGSVMATSAAFIPFALIEGIMGKFMFMIPVIVILCLVASVLEAFFVLPAHVLDILPYGRPVSEKRDGRWYAAIIAAYRRILRWCVVHRYKFLAIVFAGLIVTVGVATMRLKLVMFPPGLIDQFFVQVEMPEGTSVAETERAVSEIERVILKLPPSELEALTATAGLKGYEQTERRGTHYGQVRVFLVPQENRARQTDAILEELRPEMMKIGGIQKLVVEKLRPGPPVGMAVQVRVRGDDPGTLQEIAGRMKAELRAMEGTTDIKDNFEGGKAELRVRINPTEAAYAGVSTAEVARHILYAFEGGEVTKIRRTTEEVTVKVKFEPESRPHPQSLDGVLVLNKFGRQISLSPLVRVSHETSPPYIERYNFKRAIQITADVDNVKVTSYQANARLRDFFRGIERDYPGYDAIYGGEEERTQESMRSLRKGFGVAVFLDLIILAALFGSYIQPFIILLTIPIGLAGVAWALMLHGAPASFMALLGVVAMTGVVVNNAIVLVDFINRKRDEGMAIEDAVVEAGATRLRPIFASSITTLLGLFPTAYGIGGYEPFVAPLCLALAWGLALAMPLTLFAIPTATVIVDDVVRRFRRKDFAGAGSCKPQPPE